MHLYFSGKLCQTILEASNINNKQIKVRTKLNQSEDRWGKQTFGVPPKSAPQSTGFGIFAPTGLLGAHPNSTAVLSLHGLQLCAEEDVDGYFVLISTA